MDEIMIRDVPREERPRERLLKYGANHLSNQELLAIVLVSGTRNESVMSLANRLLMHFDGLKLLNDATIEELTSIRGIGPAKGVLILAALELGRRMHLLKPKQESIIRSPKDGADYVMEEMRTLDQEHFVVLFLNTKNEVIHQETIFIGSLNTSVVSPNKREINHSNSFMVLSCTTSVFRPY